MTYVINLAVGGHSTTFEYEKDATIKEVRDEILAVCENETFTIESADGVAMGFIPKGAIITVNVFTKEHFAKMMREQKYQAAMAAQIAGVRQ